MHQVFRVHRPGADGGFAVITAKLLQLCPDRLNSDRADAATAIRSAMSAGEIAVSEDPRAQKIYEGFRMYATCRCRVAPILRL